MDRRFKRIEMNDVRNIITKHGFYYLPMSRIYDTFTGCKYIIVTNDPDFAKHDPRYAKELIMTPEQFEPYAGIINTFFANEDRERKRQKMHCDNGYENSETVRYQQVDPVEEKLLIDLQNEHLYEAMKHLTHTQKVRLELYFFYGYTYEEIAQMQKVDKMAVFRSVETALKKIKKFFENTSTKPLPHSPISEGTKKVLLAQIK